MVTSSSFRLSCFSRMFSRGMSLVMFSVRLRVAYPRHCTVSVALPVGMSLMWKVPSAPVMAQWPFSFISSEANSTGFRLSSSITRPATVTFCAMVPTSSVKSNMVGAMSLLWFMYLHLLLLQSAKVQKNIGIDNT